MVNALIKENDLIEAIAECQGERNPNANTCIKLAAYYTIRDNMYPQRPTYSFAPERADPEVVETDGESEFMEAVDGMPVSDLMPVIDEMMEIIKVTQPRLYNSVINKLK